jgi:uncharacterized protein (TIGR03066 family)
VIAIRLLAVCVALSFVAGPTMGGDAKKADPKELIVGKWELKKEFDGKEFKATLEFLKNGKMKLSFFDQTLEGEYKIDGDNLITKVTFGEESKEDSAKFKVTDKLLTIENAKTGMALELTRVTKKDD